MMRIGGKLFLWMTVAAIAGLGPVTTAHAGVLGYWPFNDPNTPETAVDLSGNGNDGTITGGLIGDVVYTANGQGFTGNPGDYALLFTTLSGGGGRGIPGSQVAIDGSEGQFTTIEDNNQVTFAMWWFGGDVQPINQVHLWGEPDPDLLPPDAGNTRSFQTHIPWSNGQVYFDSSGCCGGGTQRVNGPIPENLWKGGWNHWTFVKDGDYKAIYANGVKMLEGVNTNPLPDPRFGIYLGYHGAFGDGDVVDGLMDDVIIFDEGLTDTADGATRVPVGALAEEGSDVWRLFSLGATSFVTPGINLSTELATIDEPQGQLLIDTLCNAEQAVTYTIASTDANILNATGSGTVTFDAGGVPGDFVSFDVGAAGTATLSTTNSAGCDDYELTVNVTAIESADLKIVTAGMEVGDTQQGTVIGSYGAAGTRDVTAGSTGTTYSSSDSSVATVDANGVITAVGEGSADITATNDGSSDVEAVNVATQLTAIALIMGKPEINEGDQGVLDLLTSLRFSGDPGQLDAGGLPPKVIPMDDDTFDTALIDGRFDLVMISSTVDAGKIGGSFRCVSIPMVFWEEGLNRVDNEALSADGGTSASAGGPDDLKEFSDLFVLNPNHEIMQGVPTDADGFANVFDSPQDISWAGAGPNARVPSGTGVLANGVESLAEYDFVDEATLLVADAGTNRLGSSSVFLGRRVFLWLSDKSADNLNEVGRGIVSRAVNWALGGQRIPLTLASLTVTGPAQIALGQEAQFTAEGIFRDCVVDLTINPDTTFTSSDPSIAAVSDTGVVRGVAGGTVTITATSGGLEGSIEVFVNADIGRQVTVSAQVASGNDDAEEHLTDFDGAANRMDLTSSDLELGAEGGVGDVQEIGIRFTNLDIPRGAIVTSASIQFTVDETDSEPTSVRIFGELSGDAATFGGAARNITDRAHTAASVDWNDIPAWSIVGDAGSNQQTPDLAAIIQEIVAQSDWAANNALAILIAPNPGGERTAESFNGDAGAAAVLTVTYLKPIVTFDFDQSGPLATSELVSFFDFFGFAPDVGTNWTIDLNNGSNALHTNSNDGQLIDQFSRVALVKASSFEAENAELSVDITWDDNDSAGVYLRASDFTGDNGEPRNFYYVNFWSEDNPNQVNLFKRKDGSDTSLGTFTNPVTIAQGSTHQITLRVTGNAASIKAWVDGQPVPGLDPFIDDDPVTGRGRAGVGHNTNPSFFDNLVMEELLVVEEGDPPAIVGDDTAISVLGCDFTDATFATTEDVTVDGVTATITGGGPAPGVTVSGSLNVSLDAALPIYEWLRLDVDVTGVDSGLSATLTVYMGHTPLDVNGDGRTNISDATAFGGEFAGGKDPSLIDENCDGTVNISDATAFGAAWNAGAANSGPLPPKP